MVVSSPSNRVTELLALGPEIAEALDPPRLTALQLPLTPGLAALSMLTSRQAFWEAHVLVVGFAMGRVDGADPAGVVAALSGRDGVSEWFEDSEFLSYAGEQSIATTHDGLIVASHIIDGTVQHDALRQAQFGTVKINYCRQRCGDNWTCMVQCLNS